MNNEVYPLYTQVETDYMDQLHAIKMYADIIGTERVKKIAEAYSDAVSRHPKFCDNYTANQLFIVRIWLDGARTTNDEISKKRGYMARDILNEEVLEAEEQFLAGNKEECLNELYQVMAVVLRMVQFVEKEMK